LSSVALILLLVSFEGEPVNGRGTIGGAAPKKLSWNEKFLVGGFRWRGGVYEGTRTFNMYLVVRVAVIMA
jgi:hypothetical protein